MRRHGLRARRRIELVGETIYYCMWRASRRGGSNQEKLEPRGPVYSGNDSLISAERVFGVHITPDDLIGYLKYD